MERDKGQSEIEHLYRELTTPREFTVEQIRDRGIAAFRRIHAAYNRQAVGDGPVVVRNEDGAAFLVVRYRVRIHGDVWSDVQEYKETL